MRKNLKQLIGMYKPDGSMSYHNMTDLDIIQAKLDIIKDALNRAGIETADYMKFIRTGEYIYANENREKGIRSDNPAAQAIKDPAQVRVFDIQRRRRKLL